MANEVNEKLDSILARLDKLESQGINRFKETHGEKNKQTAIDTYNQAILFYHRLLSSELDEPKLIKIPQLSLLSTTYECKSEVELPIWGVNDSRN